VKGCSLFPCPPAIITTGILLFLFFSLCFVRVLLYIILYTLFDFVRIGMAFISPNLKIFFKANIEYLFL